MRRALLYNWRSHRDLVAIQHVIARRIDPDVEELEARGRREVDGQIAAIWRFETRRQEAEQIAAWIAAEIDAACIEPHDIAILVRMRADVVEEELTPVFTERGLILRNVARMVGDIAIQELLAEELTAVLMPLLRLGASHRDPAAWTAAQEQLHVVFGVDPEDEHAQERLQRDIQDFSAALRAAMRDQEPGDESAIEILRTALDFVGMERLRQTFPAYRRQRDFERVADGFATLMCECAEASATWSEVLDRFEGLGQVPLMTIHKSKGF